jgi:hypothetical protein
MSNKKQKAVADEIDKILNRGYSRAVMVLFDDENPNDISISVSFSRKYGRPNFEQQATTLVHALMAIEETLDQTVTQ